MPKKCDITDKTRSVGNNVSHAKNRTKKVFQPNLRFKRFWSEGQQRWVKLRVSTKAMRTIDKKGVDAVLAEQSK